MIALVTTGRSKEKEYGSHRSADGSSSRSDGSSSRSVKGKVKFQNTVKKAVHEKKIVEDARAKEHKKRFQKYSSKGFLTKGKLIINPYEYVVKELPEDGVGGGAYVIKKYIFMLSIVQKLFVTLEIPTSCPLASIISMITFLVIVAGVVLFILSTNKDMNIQHGSCSNPVCNNDATLCPNTMICEPTPLPIFDSLDTVFIIYFTIDYVARFLSLWSAPAVLAGVDKIKYPDIDKFTLRNVVLKYVLYLMKPANLVDLASILPYYIQVGLNSSGQSSTAFIRVLRLARLVRVLKLGKKSAVLDLLNKTMQQSIPALTMASFFIGLAVILFSSIFYFIESGTFKVTADHPQGKFFRSTIAHDGSEEISPFRSIGHAIYYSVITMTTVGYGDFHCTSEEGRIVAATCCISGILVLALPLSVIANNFNTNYKDYQDGVLLQEKQEQKKRVHDQRTDQLSIQSLFENSVLYDERQVLLDPIFWRKQAGIHQKIEAIIDNQKEAAVNIRNKLNDLKDMQDYIKQSSSANTAQCDNLLKVHELGISITNKLMTEQFYVSEDQRKKPLDFLKKFDMKSIQWFVPKTFTLITPDNYYTERKYELNFTGYHHDIILTNQHHNHNSLARVFLCLEDQASCLLGKIIFAIMTLVILLGIVTFIMATTSDNVYTPSTCSNPACNNDPTLCPNTEICAPQPYPVFDSIDEFCVILFTIEYFIRIFSLWAAPCRLAGLLSSTWDQDEFEDCMTQDKLAGNTKKPRMDPPELDVRVKYFTYLTTPSNLIDLVAIVPFYISKANPDGSSSASFIRVLRLIRLLRLLKLAKKNDQMIILFQTISESLPVLGILSFFVIIMAILFGSIMFLIEQGTFKVTADYASGQYFSPSLNGESEVVSLFQSIPVGMYWAFVTCTTLGYGDFYGTTTTGRFLACVCAILGILVLALPISVVGNTFTTEYFALMERRKAKESASKDLAWKDQMSKIPVNVSLSISCASSSEDSNFFSDRRAKELINDSQVFFQQKIESIEEQNLHPVFQIQKLQDLMSDLEADEKYIAEQLEQISASALDITQVYKELKASNLARLQLLNSCIEDPNSKAISYNLLLGSSEENLFNLVYHG